MKRLLRISFDLALLSLIPVLSWFALGLLVDKNLINVFTIIYPIQFIWYTLKSVFSTGANISKIKDGNEHATMSGIFVGSVASFIIFGLIILNIDAYISFMNMNVTLYKDFVVFALIQLYIQLIFNFYIEKLYFENKNELANKYSFFFNSINFIVLVISSIIFENHLYIILTTLASIVIYLMFIVFKESEKFKLKFNLFSNIKYDSVEIVNNVAFFFIFLFGFSRAFVYGEVYATALAFVTLITDTQWDAFTSIVTAAKIDISKASFNYKEHRNNAYKLLSILLFTSILMFLVLYRFYDLNLFITLIFILFDLFNFFLFPIYKIKTYFLQLEYSSLKMSFNKLVASVLRFFMSFLKTPYCTGIGQVVSTTYQVLTINFIFHKNYKITKEGFVIKKTN